MTILLQMPGTGKTISAKQIPNFPNYFITECGKLWANGKKKRFMVTRIRFGYENVVIYTKERGHITTSIHRLVAMAYIPNPLNKPDVNHKDSNRSNNHVSNLEWCTKSENSLHSFRFGKQFITQKCRRVVSERMSKPVLNTKTGVVYSSATVVAALTGINENTLRGKLNGNRKNDTPFIRI
jgi:hypothetical protein